MEALDLLEKRLDTLNMLLGSDYQEATGDINSEDLTDSLLSASTLINSATSGRSNITDVMKRSDELENYLNPEFLDEQQNVKSKEVYINTVANELASSFESLQKIKALEPTLGAEYFRNIPDVTDKLKDMNNDLSACSQQNNMIEESLVLAMQRYSEIQSGLRDSLRDMNDRLDKFEERVVNAKIKKNQE